MEGWNKKRSVYLGIRIGLVFLAALVMVILVVFHVFSQNFQKLLTDYSMSLMESMVSQGAALVDKEIEANLRDMKLSADNYALQMKAGRTPVFPRRILDDKHTLRMLYVTRTGTLCSDGWVKDERKRADIRAALEGKSAVFGPYFNDRQEFVVCYSAPVYLGESVSGVLSVEKNGYLFSQIIQDIRFVDSGESYLIDGRGTHIAASDPGHLIWVDEQFNALEQLALREDPDLRTVADLQLKGLRGEEGVGSYEWEGGLNYVAYAPLRRQTWVLLAVLREDELASMTMAAMRTSYVNGYAMKISLAAFLLLTLLIVYWIISSMRKSSEINAKLEKIANLDALTGLFNRRFLETDVESRWKYPVKTSGQAAVFMLDIDNFKRYNDCYGHPKGDDCLRTVAGVFKDTLSKYDGYVMRYGGEEFIAVIFQVDSREAYRKGQEICQRVEGEKIAAPEGKFVTVSVGVCHIGWTKDYTLFQCIKCADCALYRAKSQGKNQAVLYDDSTMTADAPGGSSASVPQGGKTGAGSRS